MLYLFNNIVYEVRVVPLIVDKENMKREIIQAFQQCMYEKPITKVSMRDIAAKANISHAKILYYFESKQHLLLAYVEYITNIYSNFFQDWFEKKQHEHLQLEQPRDYINLFLKEVADYDNTKHTRFFVQLYTLSQFDVSVKKSIEATYESWRQAINIMLEQMYGREMPEATESLLILIEGILLYSFNDSIKNVKIEDILDRLSVL